MMSRPENGQPASENNGCRRLTIQAIEASRPSRMISASDRPMSRARLR